MAGSRRAEIGLYANAKKLKPGLQEARTMFGQFGKSVKGTVAGIGRAFGSIARVAGGVGLGAFALGAHEALEYEAALTRAAIAQGKTRDQIEDFNAKVMRSSEETGLARDQVLAAAAAYQDATGDVAGAADAMDLVARASLTTGSSVDDVSRVLGIFKDNLSIDPKAFEAGISVLITQGQQGKVTLRELASEFASVAATYAKFSGGTGLAGLTDAGAAFQVIASGAGSAGEAATRFESLMGSLQRNATKLRKKFGIEVYGKNGALRGFVDIIGEMRKKGLSGEKLFAALGSKEAVGAFDELQRKWDRFIEIRDSSINSDASQEAWKTWSGSAAGQTQKAMNDIKLAIAQAFTPERIEAFAAALGKTAEALDLVVDGLTKARDAAEIVWGGEEYLVNPDIATSTQKSSQQRADLQAVERYRAIYMPQPIPEAGPFLPSERWPKEAEQAKQWLAGMDSRKSDAASFGSSGRGGGYTTTMDGRLVVDLLGDIKRELQQGRTDARGAGSRGAAGDWESRLAGIVDNAPSQRTSPR